VTGYLTSILIQVLLLAPPILMALTVHEASHGLVAFWRGDPTAKYAGRLTLNPFKHLDLAGTVVFFVTAWFGAGIGWAKPVPVDHRRLKDPRRDMMWVSAAGPVSNLIFALLLAALLNALIQFGFFREAGWTIFLAHMMILGVKVNVILAFFNLLPLPPLDGSGIVAGLLSPMAAARYRQLDRYGFMILLGLIFLPRWLPGFPDVIDIFVLTPANLLLSALLSVLG